MKKICLVIHSLGFGGMERVMAQLAGYFSVEKKAEVHLILIGRRREVRYDLPVSVNVHRPGFEFNNDRRRMGAVRTMLFLRNIIKEIDPDIVLSFGEYWNNLVLLSLRGLKYPVYISDRSQPEKNLGRVQNILRDTLYKKSAGIIAQTHAAKIVCIQKKWNQNVIVTGNPIRRINVGAPDEKENIVLTVGRLIPTKHTDRLIAMFAEVRQPGWKLVIVGGDAKKMNLSKKLSKQIDDLGLADHVILAGQQRDVESYYRKSKIFAFTSSSEGFPNVVGEALSAGLPVISYDCIAGPADMIEDYENGFLIPLFDEDAFKEKLKLLMTDERLRKKFSEKAAVSVGKFDVHKISEKIFRFITDSAVKENHEVIV
jgi:glycosyltransferase involved in cell wall biosynthesis